LRARRAYTPDWTAWFFALLPHKPTDMITIEKPWDVQDNTNGENESDLGEDEIYLDGALAIEIAMAKQQVNKQLGVREAWRSSQGTSWSKERRSVIAQATNQTVDFWKRRGEKRASRPLHQPIPVY
jgi:hypothetical protein